MRLNIIKYFKKRTIKTNLIITLISVSLLPAIIINIFYYVRMNNFIEKKVQSYYSEIIKQTSEQISFLYSQVEIAERQLINSAITTGIFENYNEMTAEEKLIAIRQIEQSLQNVRRSFSIINNLYLIRNNNYIFTSSTITGKNKLLEKKWIKELRNEKYNEKIIPTHISDYSNKMLGVKNDKVISFVKSIKGIESNRVIGILQIDLNYSEIKKIVESLSLNDQSYMVITDQANNIIYSSDENYLGQKLDQEKRKQILESLGIHNNGHNRLKESMITDYHIPESNWAITGVISTADIDNEFKQLGKISWIITIITIFVSLLLSYLLSYEVLRPISRLINNMKKVGEGRLDIKVPDTKNRDLQVLTDSFNTMVNKVDQLMKNVRQKEEEKLKAELKALQSQINSHFLYNTLNSIKWMALMVKADDIANAIVSLVKILEYTSRNVERIVSVGKEIDFIKDYVYVQQMRSGDHIQVFYDIDERLSDYMMLKLTLQPIVENAFLHAFNDKDKGEIIIKGELLSDYIIFQIKDNGSGIQIKNQDKLTGVGIDNVRTRIKLNFGDKYGLKINSKLGDGTQIKIFLPIVERGES